MDYVNTSFADLLQSINALNLTILFSVIEFVHSIT